MLPQREPGAAIWPTPTRRPKPLGPPTSSLARLTVFADAAAGSNAAAAAASAAPAMKRFMCTPSRCFECVLPPYAGDLIPRCGPGASHCDVSGAAPLVGFAAANALLRVREPPDRTAGRYPCHRVRVREDRRRGARGGRADRRLDGDQVPGPDRRPDEGRRRQVRGLARGGRGPRGRDPRARDRRPHARRRAGRPEGRGRAGVLRRGAVGRAGQGPDDALQRHGRHRHRAGGGGAPRPRRARAPLEPPPHPRLPRQGGRVRGRGADWPRADARDPDPRPLGPAAARLRHDPRRDQPGRAPRGRLVRRPRRPHGDGGRSRRPPRGDARGDRRRAGRAARAVRALGVRAQRQGDR